MAKEFPTSASQERLLALFGLTCDGTTDHAKAILNAAGLPENGIPAGLTPQKAKRLGDDELVALFPNAATASAVAAGTASVQAARDARNSEALYWQTRQRARRDAENQRIDDIQRGRYVSSGNAEDILDDLAAANVQPADQATGQRQLREDY